MIFLIEFTSSLVIYTRKELAGSATKLTYDSDMVLLTDLPQKH